MMIDEPIKNMIEETSGPGDRFIICYCCAEVGHRKSQCFYRNSQCECCGRLGHIYKTCWRRQYTCHACHTVGHLRAMCPESHRKMQNSAQATINIVPAEAGCDDDDGDEIHFNQSWTEEEGCELMLTSTIKPDLEEKLAEGISKSGDLVLARLLEAVREFVSEKCDTFMEVMVSTIITNLSPVLTDQLERKLRVAHVQSMLDADKGLEDLISQLASQTE